MASDRKPSAPIRRLLITLALLAGWVLVVTVGAGQRPDESPLLGVANLGVVLIIPLLILALIGLVLIIYLKPNKPTEVGEETRPRRSIYVAIGLIILFTIWNPEFVQESSEAPEQAETEETSTDDEVDPTERPAAETVAQATDLILIALGIGAVGAIWYLARHGGELIETGDDADDGVNEQLEAELAVAMDQALVELTGDDPRTAVLNAYASLERVLASREHERAPSETTAQHVQRVVASLRVDPAPLVELGALYEIARFSRQNISADQQRQAHRALEQARQGLGTRT